MLQLNKWKRTPVRSFLLSTAALVSPALAGNGSFDSGKFDFCVSVRFDASEAQLDQIRAALQNGSDVLADATDGQHRFGEVTIVNNSGASQSSEYWINSGAGRAYATFAKYGVRGEHVNMYMDSNFQANNGADGDAYTVAHEHIHHAYGVADEYSGPSGGAEDAPPPDSATLNYSIMDNYFTRGGRSGTGTTYTLNEMCVASNHDPDGDTWQEDRNGESAWETVAGQTRFPISAPSALPVSTAPSSQAVNFLDGIAGLRAMLVLDRSGSMSINQRLEFAKQGSSRFVDLLNAGDGVGVASFSSSGSVNSLLTTITGNATRVAAKNAIDSLSAGGSTNIGGGLLAGLGQITSQTDRSCNELIILLSDGDHNTGTAPASVIPQLQKEGVTVLSIGVGSGLSTSGEATLQNVATQTGGRFYRAAAAADLNSVFIQLAAETTGSGILARSPQAIASNQSLSVDVPLEPGISEAVFALTKQSAGDDIQLSLLTPSGELIPASTARLDVNVNSAPNSIIFEVESPEQGTWSMVVESGVVTNGQIETIAYAANDGVALNLSVGDDVLSFPDSVALSATPRYNGEAVVGALVEGTVRRPNAPDVSIVFNDTGQGLDGQPNDGIYTAEFSDYSEDGTYTFDVEAKITGAETYSGESLFDSDPSNSAQVPDFVRQASTTAVVSGIPDFVMGTLEIGPEVINLNAKSKWITAYIELPDGIDPHMIDPSSLSISAIDGNSITPILVEDKFANLGDHDSDGIQDLMVKFDRQELHSYLPVDDMVEIEIDGMLTDGRMLKAVRFVGVINPVQDRP